MANQDTQLIAFNRGVISSIGLARVDLNRYAMAAEIQNNYIPRVLGSMMLRPGFGYIDNTNLDQGARNLPFVFGVDDKALIEMGNVNMKVRIDDVVITRPAVTATISNGGFGSGLASWTDASDTGGTAAAPAGYAHLKGDGTDFGRIRQTITVNETSVEHALTIDVEEGPVLCKVGSTAGDDDYVSETRLDRGLHSLAFTPTGDFIIELGNEREFNAWVDSVAIESAGEMELLTPYGEEDLQYLRWTQSGDVIYLAGFDDSSTDNTKRLMKIERRGTGRSWSLTDYLPEDGPFKVQNVTGIELNVAALNGDTTLTASQPLFRAEHAQFKSIFRVASSGQTVTSAISSANDWTDPIRVTGKEAARVFQVIIENITDSTAKLQFAFTPDGPWNDSGREWTSATNENYDDGQDDSIIYYRLGIDTGDYGTDTVTCTLVYGSGSIEGVCRVRNFTSSTVVNVQVLQDFGSIDPSKDWWEGEFSLRRKYPTSVAITEGRLWWAGNNRLFGSVSDDYDSFDDATEGDSGPISRSIGSGPIRTINWLLPMARLLIGTSDMSANVGAERIDGNNPLSARSSNFDNPLTPTNFNIKTASSKGVFVDRTEQRIFELVYDVDVQDYKSSDLSIFTPDFNVAGIKQIAVQMKPDVRIHCVRNDGTVGMLVYDRAENVVCWIDIESPGADGEIEDVSVLPGTVEDQVYYIIKRTINSSTERHICKWALESEAIGGTVNKMADSFTYYSGAPTTTITGLDHLEGETVSVWADGAEIADGTVASGEITLVVAASDVIVGLNYTARFKSTKMGGLEGIGLLEHKMLTRLGLLAENLHYQGVQYGPDFDNLDDLPLVEQGEVTAADTIWDDYHEENFPFGGEWTPDSRICLQSQSPRPCTIRAALGEFQSVEKLKRR